ncbi:MAG: NAD(P)/FAD-dependent oxidoreductase [Thiohalobacterales bacterium]
MNAKPVIEISGAGPAGLAAALAVTAAGQQALVYEKRADVGSRFHGDFQGLENWTTKGDVLEELASMGINAGFEHVPVREFVCFDPDGIAQTFHSGQPLFYLVRRGGQPGSLDHALKQQALAEGVEIRFNTPASNLPNGGVVTEGPRRADAIAAGYLFDTDMADGIYAAISDELAPKGYAYLLINQGHGTLASCLFNDFHNEREYVERCVAFFDKHVGLRMDNPHRFGGSGNFSLPKTARKGNILYAGEAAGFQDPLFGFGIRWALLSGAAAGRALAAGDPRQYEKIWKRRLRSYHQTAATNRWFYDRLGNRGYRLTLQHFPKNGDVRNWVRHAYTPRLWKRAWYHLVAARRYTPLLNPHEDCDCTWCRCNRHMKAPAT